MVTGKNPRTKKTRECSAKTIGCRSFEDKETNFVERHIWNDITTIKRKLKEFAAGVCGYVNRPLKHGPTRRYEYSIAQSPCMRGPVRK